MNLKSNSKSLLPDLSNFYIESVKFAEGCLSIEINGSLSQTRCITFSSHEAFQLFHESDYHPIFDKYDLSPLTPVHEGDCAVFRVTSSPFYDLFCESNGRYLETLPGCFLISTADERVEVITFDEPSFT